MKRTVTTFGLIAGLILTVFLCISVPFMKHQSADSVATSMFVGYTVQLLTFSLIFFAIRQYRDKYSNGLISFGKAFRIGLWISLIGAAFYVMTWAILYHTLLPDYLDTWGAVQVQEAVKKGARQEELAAIREQLADAKRMYSTWWGFAGITLMEILPSGLLVTLISALILKRKRKKDIQLA
ncbi:MAG TPA: DUF4199 domain-containing protein [Flavisolibacter sp.]|jgi:uncharacterized membrane protein|nr:DUF4199 domain-containing protein [Flavisolibacter sp.]